MTPKSLSAAGACGLAGECLELLAALVQEESPSGDDAANVRVAEILETAMTRAGANVESVAAPGLGVHLMGRFPGHAPECRDERPLLLLGHMDTVHPAGTLKRFPFAVGDDRVEGPGAYDMKAGLAVAVAAMRFLAAKGSGPRTETWLLVTCDEEIGAPHSRPTIESGARLARAGLVLEPCAPGGAAKTRRKGVAEYRLAVRGRPAHAGIEPDKGASAVHELAHQIERVLELDGLGEGTTVNAGTIRGGTRSNVVAEDASCAIDVRFWTRAAGERADGALRSLLPRDSRCSLHLEGGINRGPLERTEASALLFEQARGIAQSVGLRLGEACTGGASDGNIASAAGLPVLDGLGPDGGGAHTLDEHVLLDDVPRRIDFLAALVERL